MAAPRIEIEGAVVAITGAGRGIGRASAELFAARGATVCLGDLDGDSVASAAASLGSRAHAFHVDVRGRESFAEFLESAQQAAGPIDVLVNNAGVMPVGRFLDEHDATTDTVVSVNLIGPINGMRLVLPAMIERGRGHVVNVASLLGKTELPGLATYTATKHALVGLSAGVRSELGGTGVTVSTILPSVVNTELSSGIGIPAPLRWLARVEPEDVAAAIAASCESRASEIAVPRWLGIYPVMRPFIPARVERLVRRLVGDDRALSAVDPATREAYEERIANQTIGADSTPRGDP